MYLYGNKNSVLRAAGNGANAWPYWVYINVLVCYQRDKVLLKAFTDKYWHLYTGTSASKLSALSISKMAYVLLV